MKEGQLMILATLSSGKEEEEEGEWRDFSIDHSLGPRGILLPLPPSAFF